MACPTCSGLEECSADTLAKEALPHTAKQLVDLGYHGDDLDAFHLLKCPECGSYFRRHDWDHFEEGGAVGVCITRIGPAEAAGILEKVVEKIQRAEWLQNRYDLGEIKKELKCLTRS
ncbi:MAG: hypothetical protein Q8P02_03225 [Candidatus Micrarchaeota archaeon]|nr:hypothetical protein [Candidatus Micrarchaeota archaeon]